MEQNIKIKARLLKGYEYGIQGMVREKTKNSFGSDGACLPFANVLFAHYRPLQPPVGGVHAAFSSHSLGGGFSSSPIRQITK